MSLSKRIEAKKNEKKQTIRVSGKVCKCSNGNCSNARTCSHCGRKL